MKRAVWLKPKGLGCLPDPPKLVKAWLGCQLPRLDSGEVGRGTWQSTSSAGGSRIRPSLQGGQLLLLPANESSAPSLLARILMVLKEPFLCGSKARHSCAVSDAGCTAMVILIQRLATCQEQQQQLFFPG